MCYLLKLITHLQVFELCNYVCSSAGYLFEWYVWYSSNMDALREYV